MDHFNGTAGGQGGQKIAPAGLGCGLPQYGPEAFSPGHKRVFHGLDQFTIWIKKVQNFFKTALNKVFIFF
jgi:hypothetical protein